MIEPGNKESIREHLRLKRMPGGIRKEIKMSGPIIRTGATPEFWNNWDNVFGKKSRTAARDKAAATTEKKEEKPAAKKKSAAGKTAAKPAASKKAVAKKTAAKTTKKK